MTTCNIYKRSALGEVDFLLETQVDHWNGLKWKGT